MFSVGVMKLASISPRTEVAMTLLVAPVRIARIFIVARPDHLFAAFVADGFIKIRPLVGIIFVQLVFVADCFLPLTGLCRITNCFLPKPRIARVITNYTK
jgi:hypothetical protein